MGDVSTSMAAGQQEIVDAEGAWAEAVRRKDHMAADQLVADEFRLTGPELQRLSTGRAATKELWMMTLDRLDVQSFALRDIQVTTFGSSAVAFVHATIDWSIEGRALPREYMLTDLWVKREGHWQVVTRVSEPARE